MQLDNWKGTVHSTYNRTPTNPESDIIIVLKRTDME